MTAAIEQGAWFATTVSEDYEILVQYAGGTRTVGQL